ncbi:hypothetical protein WME73_01235 [Sorangium sp. So ce302]|uniref:hypothetical protein n=1 Tax=Sorangium sp. So ce302 TaxID=3133297 RepID=UPI003F613D0C
MDAVQCGRGNEKRIEVREIKVAPPVLLLGVGAGARRRQLLQASPRLLERA